MIDVKLDENFDLEIENGDFAGVEGLDTAIFVSLGTDGRAPDDRVLIPEYRRGWLGDVNNERNIGSLLWLLEQRRLTQGTVNEAVTFAQNALQWMVDDNIAVSVTVSGDVSSNSGITLSIIIKAPDGSTESHYVPLWEVTGNAS